MECLKVRDLLSDYYGGMLDDSLNAEIENHIQGCVQCSNELNMLRSVIDTCRQIDEEDLPEGFEDKLHSALISEADNKRKNRLSIIKKYCTTAAALLIVVLSFSLLKSGVFGLKKSSSSPARNMSTGSANKGIESNGGMAPQTTSGTDGANQSSKDNATKAGNNIIDIKLSSDEYKKYYDDLAVIIEGMDGYIINKEPVAYMMPGKNADSLISRIKESYNLTDISRAAIESQMTSLENSIESTNSTNNEELKKQLSLKRTELESITNMNGYIVVEININ